MKYRPALFLLFCLSLCGVALAQKQLEIPTETTYLQLDKALWSRYNEQVEALFERKDRFPDQKDSLKVVYDSLYRSTTAQNVALALRFASVPSGLQRVYMVRLDVPKDTLRAVLNRLPQAMQRSPYGKSLALHIRSHQIQEGDRCVNFSAVCADGTKFMLSSLKGKQVLLLYGGLGCMGDWGREYLRGLYARTDRDRFRIVIYWPCSSSDELTELTKLFPSDYLFVSDFLGDHTPVKIRYGAQATPTCVLIGSDGRVLHKSVGLDPEAFDRLIR